MTMPNVRKLIRNFTSAAGMRVAVSAVSFAFFVLLARRWGSIELGEFATVFSFFVVLQQAPLLGLHVPFIRDLARRPDSLHEMGPSAAVLAIAIAGVLGALLGLVGERYYPASMQPSFWLVGVSLVPGALLVIGESAFVSQERLGRVAALSIGENLVRTCVWLVLLVLGYGLTALFLALAILRALTLLAYYGPPDLRPVLRFGRCRRDAVAGLLGSCPIFLGILVLAATINRLDFIMLSRLGTLEQVGLYSAPYKVYETALMVPSVLALALFPAFATTFATSERHFEHLVRQSLRVCLTAGVPCAIALSFLADLLMVALFGSVFQTAAPVLVILAVGPVLVAMDQCLTMAMLASGRERLDLRVLACACGYYAIALRMLIPAMGIDGAALATASAAAVQVAVRYRLVRTRLGMRSMADVAWRPVVAGVLMAATGWATRPASLIGALFLGSAVYAATLALLRAVTRADVQWIRRALERPREAS